MIHVSRIHDSSPLQRFRASVHSESAPDRRPSCAEDICTCTHHPPPSAFILPLTLAVLAAAAVRRAAQDADTNAERVRGEAVLAVLLARGIAGAVTALFEEIRVLGDGGDCWDAQGLAG